ncbi:MAG TPA: M48 family metallopeptidase [Ktedonobacteraceae bacterium]|nr:M48 family metallopeptidase [Ktedonobacteraceae bacterium]
MEIDAGRQQKAREYARVRRRLSFVSMGIAAVALLLIFVLGLDKWLRNVIQGIAFLSWQPVHGWSPLQILLYFLLAVLAYQLITMPIVYYSGYVLPHRYGMSTQSVRGWARDFVKGFVLGLVLEAAAITLIYALLAYQPLTWWIWVAVVMLFFSVIMANLAPILIFPLFYKFTPLPEGELTQRLLALMQRASTRVRGVYTMQMSNKTTAANAALMGLGNTRRVVLGDTMLDRYSVDEIEVVLAHELGHHVHRDIWKLIVSQAVLTLGGLYIANLLLHSLVAQGFYTSLTDAATLPVLFLLMGVFGLVVMPISNGYSRLIEYQADEYALQATGKVEQFKSAMTRLANQNLSEIEPSPIVEFLFYSHPSIGKRLRHADEFAQRRGYAFNASASAPS